MAKKKQTDEPKVKTMGLFDHLNVIRGTKTPWEDLSESDKKSFSVYMINRYLSMSMDYIDLINQLQKYTIGVLDAREVYKLYCDILPKDKSFIKYIKGIKDEKFNNEVIDIVKTHYLCSKQEAEEYVELLITNHTEDLKRLLSKYGKNQKEIEKLLNN